MKKVIIVAMAALALLTAQCKKNEPKPSEKVMVPVTGTVDFGGSKTEITTAGYITPSAGDKIYIYHEGENVGYVTCTPTVGQQFACSGEIEEDCLGQSCTFMYLGSNNGTDGASETISFADQAGVSVSNGKISGIDKFHVGSCTATVAADGTVSLPMVSKMSLAYFRLKDKAGNAVAFEDVTVSGLSSTATINKVDGTLSGSGTDAITVHTGADGSFYMALIPQEGPVRFVFNGEDIQGTKVFSNGIRPLSFYSEQGSGKPLQVVMSVPFDTDEWINFNDPSMGVENMPIWSKKNLGATNGATKESWYGNYYQWGSSTPADPVALDGWVNCPYTAGTYSSSNPGVFTKYVPSDKTEYWYNYQAGSNEPDNKTDWELEDDPSTTLGDGWRIANEWTTLEANTYFEWTENYKGIDGLNGYVFFMVKNAADKGKHDTPNATYNIASDPHMFLPAAGDHNGQGLYSYGCLYWSSYLYSNRPNGAIEWWLNYGSYSTLEPSCLAHMTYNGRCAACPIRSVRPVR